MAEQLCTMHTCGITNGFINQPAVIGGLYQDYTPLSWTGKGFPIEGDFSGDSVKGRQENVPHEELVR